MAFEALLTFNISELEGHLEDRFGEGSPAQYEWSRIVFYGGVPYMPMVTNNFINLSIIASEPLFSKGELLYPGPYAHFLWAGEVYVDPETGSPWAREGVTKIPAGRPLTYNQEANALAGGAWNTRSANDNYPAWAKEFQGLVDAGVV